MAQKKISIIEIADIETKQILKNESFSKLKPVTCTKCGNQTDFERRLFQIMGVPKNQRSDDEIQGVIRYHLQQKHMIDFIFFKSHGRKFITDTALCMKCQSTAVSYDIEIDSDLISMIAKTTGQAESQIKKDLDDISEKIKKD